MKADSEWHSFFECPLTLKPRERFYLSDNNTNKTIIHRHTISTPKPKSHFIELIVQCQENRKLMESLAYLSKDVFHIRRAFFKKTVVESAAMQDNG